MVKRLVLCFLLLWLSYIGVLRAEPITFSESSQGDLSDGLPSPIVFALGVGVNTFTGTLGTAMPGGFDSIAFSVPPAAQLSSVAYSFVTSFLPGTTEADSVFYLVPSNAPAYPALDVLAVIGRFPGQERDGTAFSSGLPLGPGTYGIFHGGMSFSSRTGEGGFLQNYRWSLTVRKQIPGPIPEPATLVLIVTGLVGSVCRKYRHHPPRWNAA